MAERRMENASFRWIYLLFFVSGFPALIYQIVWQRALFAIYGVNIESVTVVVSAFMLGLGLGSLIGGRISKQPAAPLLLLFGGAELGIAAYGVGSLALFHRVAAFTAGAPAAETGLLRRGAGDHALPGDVGFGGSGRGVESPGGLHCGGAAFPLARAGAGKG
jgi:hypothetical protein